MESPERELFPQYLGPDPGNRPAQGDRPLENHCRFDLSKGERIERAQILDSDLNKYGLMIGEFFDGETPVLSILSSPLAGRLPYERAPSRSRSKPVARCHTEAKGYKCQGGIFLVMTP